MEESGQGIREDDKVVEFVKKRTGYMCKIDFDHELGSSWHPSKVYVSKDSLLSDHACADECGIVEVEVRLIGVVKDGTY